MTRRPDRGRDLPRRPGSFAGAPEGAARFICGFLACDPLLSQAFLGGLPPLLKVNIRDDPSGQWLENSLRFSVTEAGYESEAACNRAFKREYGLPPARYRKEKAGERADYPSSGR